MDLDSFGIHYRLLPWAGSWFGHEGDDDVSKVPAGRAVHHFFSEFFDWNDPPLFKNFLRIDASPDEVRFRCFAATSRRGTREGSPARRRGQVPAPLAKRTDASLPRLIPGPGLSPIVYTSVTRL
jgi:hypothetical protein